MNEKPNTQDDVNIFERINVICKEFRRSLRAREHPRIEDWLIRVGREAQTTLFSNLLEIEINGRMRQGRSPKSGEYLKRFPQFASQVRQAFDESTIGSMEAGQRSTPADSAGPDITRTFETPAANRLGDYELVRELGRGGFGVVYEARHVQRNNRVALKTLPTGVDGQELNAERLHRFRKEFRSLSEINHPNLVGMQTLEVDGSQWFFTMDLIEGVDFLSYVRPMDQLDEDRLRSALKQLASGIIFLHEQGIVHRDLKPSNVLVDESGRVLILDFGLVAQLQTNADMTVSRSGMFAGTPRYAAPEQMFGQRSEASDWYAFGTMLYESLTGQPPFAGKPMDLLIQKQNQDPPTLVEQEATETTEDLAGLTDGLLKREPSERFNTTQIIEVLQLDLETRTYGSTAGSKGSTGSVDEEQLDPLALADEEIVLIGREQQLAQLESAKQELFEKRQPIVVWITGKSGEGKSSLAENFLRPIRLGDEMLVLSGRCYDRESVPFKAVDCWLDSLIGFLRSSVRLPLESLVPPDAELLAEVFPVFNRVDAIAKLPPNQSALLTGEKRRYRAFGALRELLVRVSTEVPIVIFVDDLQWSDADSVAAFRQIFADPDPPTVLLLGSFRSDEQDQSSFLNAWKGDRNKSAPHFEPREIEVGPLTRSECIQMVATHLNCDRDLVREQVLELYHETAGNPYFVEQLIEGFDPASATFQAVPIQQAIATKLSRLPAEAQPILEAIAVSGQAIALREAEEIAEQGVNSFAVLTHMRNEKLVRLIGSGDQLRVDTFHDKVRESTLAQMPPPQLQSWHRRIGETIQRVETVSHTELETEISQGFVDPEERAKTVPRVFDLAYHFHEARDPRALAYQIAAGEQALRNFANEEAIAFLRQAKESISELSPQIQFRILEALGRAYLGNAQGEQAITSLKQALEVATSEQERVRALTDLGTAHSHLALIADAISYFDQALNELGAPRASTFIGRLMRIGIGVAKVTARTKIRKSVIQQRERRATSLHEIYIRSWEDILEKDYAAAIEAEIAAAVTGLSAGKPALAALGFLLTSIFYAALGFPMLSQLLIRRSHDVQADVDDEALFALIPAHEALSRYFQADFLPAEIGLLQAMPGLRRCGEFKDLLLTTHVLRHIHAWTRSSGAELDTAKKVLAIGEEIGNPRGMCWGNYDVAHALARSGSLPEARKIIDDATACFVGERWYETEAIYRSTFGYVLIQCSDYDGAQEVLEKAWKIVVGRWYFLEFPIRSLPLLIESIVGPNWNEGSSKKDAKILAGLCRWAWFLKRSFPTHETSLLRSLGRVAFARGKKRKAIRYFRQSIAVAQKRGMPYFKAQALLDLAAAKKESSDENRAEAIRLLKKMESVIPRAESWLLGDQYDETVVAPEFDLEAWEQAHVKVSPGLEVSE